MKSTVVQKILREAWSSYYDQLRRAVEDSALSDYERLALMDEALQGVILSKCLDDERVLKRLNDFEEYREMIQAVRESERLGALEKRNAQSK